MSEEGKAKEFVKKGFRQAGDATGFKIVKVEKVS